MATARNRSTRKLKPWLVEQIESGKFPGLRWDDDQKTCFRVPWKHAGKQDFRHNEDAAIFMAWAQYKNKYKDGDKVEAAVWKTRFRCALNKSPEFEEVSQRSQLEISEPYKVYRIVPLEEQGSASSERTPQKRKSTAQSRNSNVDEVDPEKKPHVKLEQYVAETVEMANCVSADSGNGSDTSGADIPCTDQKTSKFEPCQADLNSTLNMNFLQSPVVPSEITYTDLQVTVFYSGVEVSTFLVQSGACKLSACVPLCRNSGMEHILLPPPPPHELLDKDTCKKTESLLKYLEAGVMLASNTDGIFAQRQKKCSGRVFWIGPCVNSSGTINKLERDEHVKLFDRPKFLQGLETYRTVGGVPPVSNVTLFFGEEPSDKDPIEDKLITAKIEQVMASEMVDEAIKSRSAAQTQSSVLKEPTFLYLTPVKPVDTLDGV